MSRLLEQLRRAERDKHNKNEAQLRLDTDSAGFARRVSDREKISSDQ